MGFLKKITRPIRKIVKKIVPKEIQPFLPIAASFLPVAPGLGGLFSGIKNPLLQAALKRGTQSALVQSVTDEGDIDPFTTAMAGLSAGLSEVGSAGLPGALKTTEAGLKGVDPGLAKGVMEGRSFLEKAADIGKSGIMKVADVAKEAGPFKTAATTSGIVATKEAYDAAQDALDEYNRSLTEAGVTDNSERVSLIRRYMSNAGFDESQIESALGRYGYLAAGGRVGYQAGGPIYPRIDGLSSGVSEAEQTLQEINQRLQSAESTLGEGGAMQQPLFDDNGIRLGDQRYGTPLGAPQTQSSSLGMLDKRDYFAQRNPNTQPSNLFLGRPVLSQTSQLSQLNPMMGQSGVQNIFANGGRVGLEFGGIPEAVEKVEEEPKEFMVDKLKVTVQPGQSEQMAIMNAMMNDIDGVMPEDRKQEFYRLYLPQLRQSGEISETQYEGLMNELFGEEMQNGGIMNLKGKEMDLRGGGFVPIGAKERADDVPARLSKNEFVFTADAVRAAGGGSVQKGAEKMYNTMKMLEGKIA